MRRILLIGLISLAGCNALTDVDEVGREPCEIYCNIMSENCSETFNGDLEACSDACEEFPTQPQNDEQGNTIPLGARVDNADSTECRIYHGEIASESGRPPNNEHCGHAGPTGGGTCSDADPDCAALCYNLFDACSDEETRSTEDYFDCEQECQREVESNRNDEPEFQCRLVAAKDAAEAKKDGRPAQRAAACFRAIGGGEGTCLTRADIGL
jgi:hypothetical protein